MIVYINDLNMWSVKNVKILIEEINMIKEIKIISGFKCIIESEYQKICNISHSIEKHCRNTHNWNIVKIKCEYFHLLT